MSNEYDNNDPLYLPEGIVPPGMVYAWQTSLPSMKVAKEELRRKHYNIVPRKRHPYIYSDDSVPGTISRKGNFLIERKEEVHKAFSIIRDEENRRHLEYYLPGLSPGCHVDLTEEYKKGEPSTSYENKVETLTLDEFFKEFNISISINKG